MLQRLLGVLAPLNCIECGREGTALCIDCSSLIPRCSPVPHLTCVDRYTAATIYGGVVEKLIHQLKYARRRSVANSLARFMSGRSAGLLDEATIITYIPSSPGHYRSRGYNQGAALAKEVAKLSSLPCRPLLWRVGGSQQVGSDRRTRQRQAARAFTPRYQRIIRGATVLIVDDVVTTGATVSAAAGCLRLAGAARVLVMSVAYQPYIK